MEAGSGAMCFVMRSECGETFVFISLSIGFASAYSLLGWVVCRGMDLILTEYFFSTRGTSTFIAFLGVVVHGMYCVPSSHSESGALEASGGMSWVLSFVCCGIVVGFDDLLSYHCETHSIFAIHNSSASA